MLIIFAFFGVFLVTLFFYWKIPFYFYLMDDWSGIDQYQKFGMKSISLSVNEHFVPIDRILYYIETKIYGQSCTIQDEPESRDGFKYNLSL